MDGLQRQSCTVRHMGGLQRQSCTLRHMGGLQIHKTALCGIWEVFRDIKLHRAAHGHYIDTKLLNHTISDTLNNARCVQYNTGKLKLFVPGLSPRSTGFSSRSVHVGSAVQQVALGQLFSCQYHSTNPPPTRSSTTDALHSQQRKATHLKTCGRSFTG